MKIKKILFAIIICIFSIYCGITDNNGNQSSITKLYVTMQQTEEVAIYSTPDLTLLKTIYFDFTNQDFPHFIVLDEVNGYWFVTIMERGWVAQYSLITDELIDTVYVGDFPALMTVNPDEKKLYREGKLNCISDSECEKPDNSSEIARAVGGREGGKICHMYRCMDKRNT